MGIRDLRALGESGLRVAPLCLGGNVFGWTADEAASFAVLDAYTEGGGNFVDTADAYSRWVPGHAGGESEAAIGRWMKARGNRGHIVIATKVGSAMGDGPDMKGLARRRILAAADDSLRRLQTDYIDLYQAHQDDADTPLEETLAAFDELVRAGKVRAIGASNYTAARLREALGMSERLGLARYISLQPFYNLAIREGYERELEPTCRALGLGVIPYSSLASGFLTGKYRQGAAPPPSQRARGVQSRYMNTRGFAILDAVDRVAAARGATIAQVALAWLMARPTITAPIASATTAEQARELLGAASLTLSSEEIAALDAASNWQSQV